ncbi:FAD-dependent oxidoreductase [Mycobacterium sp. 050128]|nr:FAD-dependent oxidoreductase [Mycobacterium intracellulare]ARV80177.1 FAD-dependent oxidoreductase [Mycobacterium intracellulare subsp. chimaera]ASL18814.1 FAD-dependent pyridine nucleotide-disulfide oxidoreductase [Mycobacterium intracellulare subsp. chimaera]ETZ38612.1 pyridine nucleotide-disulfide oxidoreductase family protein [Mycobacterium intracellulare MIN_052511_1280]KPN46282.1 pyridine nucleotide-disulfide oxidoreductase [Mycobacterium intracellulare subsp. chimaera]MDM3909644.1 FA
MRSRVVIVGTSVGGVRTAQALRSEGYDGDIILVGEETTLPYDKPPLSKALLAGTTNVAAVTLLTEEAAAAADIRLLLGHRAVRVDAAACQVAFAGHEPLNYDHLVVATGASARPSPWGQRPGIHLLRTLEDCLQLRADLVPGGHLVVVGGGFIGAEVASTARTLGLEVTIVDPLPVPMSRVLNAEIGGWFVDLHRRHQVCTRFGVGVENIEGERSNLKIRLTDGTALEASAVVVGIGAVPNDGWLKSSGLVVDDGLVCDQYCRAVTAPNIYAVGDVSRWFHQRRGRDTRVEHWTNAVDQAACVAHNITHPHDLCSYEPVEYVWSDQHDWKIQVAGRTAGISGHATVGDPAIDKRFAALYTDDGQQLSGAAIVNWPRALIECRRALQAGGTFASLRERIEALRN